MSESSGLSACSPVPEPTISALNGAEDSRQWGSLRTTPIAKSSCPNVSEPESRSLATSENLILLRFLERLTLFTEVSRARILAPPALALALRVNEAVYGLSSSDAFAWLDRDTLSWRTLTRSRTGEWESFSGHWPLAGTMRNGIAYQRSPSGQSTMILKQMFGGSSTGTGSSRLQPFPTPTANEYGFNQSASGGASVRPSLQTMARKNCWPTPTASDANPNRKIHIGHNPTLQGAVQSWPTPTAKDNTGREYGYSRGDHSKKSMFLPGAVRASARPTPSTRDWKDTGPNCNYAKMDRKSRLSGRIVMESLRKLVRNGSSTGSGNGVTNVGLLNPAFDAFLQGLPLTWTKLGSAATRTRPNYSNISVNSSSRTQEGGD